MWIPVFLLAVFIIWLLVYFWPLTLTALALWGFVVFMGREEAEPKPVRPRKAIKAPPAAKPVQTRPAPEPEPGYRPRWTPIRRMHAEREQTLWQKRFDDAGRDAEGADLAPRMTKP
jgi:hypothetical protein